MRDKELASAAPFGHFNERGLVLAELDVLISLNWIVTSLIFPPTSIRGRWPSGIP
jgi:hypothetical protein